ncbi:MAG: hypothetical protein ACRDPH_06195 [Marmoricola sp.]
MTLTPRLGAGCLLGGSLLGLVSVLLRTTLSESAGDQVAALARHHDAMLAGMALSTVAVVLWVGGVIWLALAARFVTPRSALVGGILGVAGAAAVVFGNGVTAAAYGVVHGLGDTSAAALLDRAGSAGEIADPFALLGDLAFIVLAVDVLRVGVSRWMAAVVAVGAVAEGAGFALGSSAVAVVGFALLFIGLAGVSRTLLRTSPASAAENLAGGPDRVVAPA